MPQFIAASAFAYSSTGAPAVTLPAHNEGDFLILFSYHREDSPVPDVSSISTAGWTRIDPGATPVFQDLGPTGLSLTAWYKFAGASEGNPTITWDDSYHSGAMVAVYRGVNTDTPLDGVTVGSTTNPNTNSATISATPNTDNAWLMGIWALDDDAVWTAGNGGTVDAQGETASGSDAAIGIAHEAVPTAQAESFTVSGGDQDAQCSMSFVLKPATGPQDVTTGTVPSTSALYPPELAYQVELATIASSAALYPPTVVPQAVGITVGTIASSAAVYAPVVALAGIPYPPFLLTPHRVAWRPLPIPRRRR